MRIGIIGTGRMGGGLGKAWARAGHDVMFSFSRDPQRLERLAADVGPWASTGSPADAARFGDAVMLAVPWAAVPEAVAAAGRLDGVVLIECTNALTPDMGGLEIGHTTSASEEVARLAPGAKVVKAFNSVFAESLHAPAPFGADLPTVFHAGDDADAKTIAAALIEACGFEPVDAGPLRNARYIEPMGMLFIQLAYGQGLGPNIANKLLRR